jgi:hypothetical protein
MIKEYERRAESRAVLKEERSDGERTALGVE